MSSHRRSRARFEEENDENFSGSELPKRSPSTADGTLVGDNDDDSQRIRGRSRNSSRGTRIKSSPSRSDRQYGISEFQTGAIVRVLVENFVTYEHAEFNPGPNLNMVIGPNGTGKSSLVCAICLGLGFHPKHLGRASNVGEFVKHGKEAAIVELELQSPPGKRSNHIIRMQIRKEDNKTKWWINGKDCNHQAVKNLTSELRIQIDNLCQFLPQDRVAEFAGLTPVLLLQETLRAAAPEQMIRWHDQLKELHRKHKDLKAKLDGCVETLKGHEARQQGSQADVDRLREREAIQSHIQDLHRAHAIAEYNTFRRLVAETKQMKQDATRRLDELQEACGPALEAVNQKQEYQRKIEAVVEQRKRALRDAEAACDQLLQAIEAQDEKVKHLQNKRIAEDNSHSTKRSDLARIRRTITDLEAKLQNKPPEFVGSEWNQKIRQQEHILRENEAEKRTLRTQFEELKDLNIRKNAAKAMAEKELQALNSQDGQKLAHLRKLQPEAARGWDWLQEHQGEFEKEVFGPPMITCSVTDKRLSDQIQSLLSQDDFFCFTCQTRNDHKKLSAQFYKHMGLSVSIRTCGSEFASFRPGIPKEQIRAMGLDGYAIEYLEGPEPILAMLCSERRLHISGVGYRDTNDDQYDQIVSCERIPSWATQSTIYRTTRRREYGAGAVSTATRRVNPGRFWTDQPVDQAERVALQRRINELDEEVQEIRRQGQENKARVQEIDDNDEPIRQQIEALRKEKNELQRAATQYATLGDKIGKELPLGGLGQKLMDYSDREEILGRHTDRTCGMQKENIRI
ncbi:P-loop containing nucleoside triphosphate hydrolase protein [Annulohypoxylon moriforme]|nr:P-loop containing nucleoside triphosphate hydrolase protein [Annulohypoxylon moriforme]